MRAYAKLSGLNVSIVSRQVRDGVIPTHGANKLIDSVEADEAPRRVNRCRHRVSYASPPRAVFGSL